MDDKITQRYSNILNRQTRDSNAFVDGIDAGKENTDIMTNDSRDLAKENESSEGLLGGSQQGRRSSMSLLARRGASPLLDRGGGDSPSISNASSWLLRAAGRAVDETVSTSGQSPPWDVKVRMTVESPRSRSRAESQDGGRHLVLMPHEDQAEQLKREVDILLNRKESLERETMFVRQELDMLLGQKTETKDELSDLMAEMESARETLEYLQLDLEKEEEKMASHRQVALSQLRDNAEQTKDEFVKQMNQARRSLEEKEKEMELLRIRLEKRSLDVDKSERDLEERERRLNVRLAELHDRKESMDIRIEEREQSLVQREAECDDLWRRANDIFVREKCVTEKEKMIHQTRVELQHKEHEIENLAKDIDQDRKIMRESGRDFESQRKDFEAMRSIFTEQMEREKLSIQGEKELIAQRKKELLSEEERLNGIAASNTGAEKEAAQLLAQIEMSKQDLQSLNSKISEQEDAYTRILKTKSETLENLQAREKSLEEQKEHLMLLERKISEDRDLLTKEAETVEATKEDVERKLKVRNMWRICESYDLDKCMRFLHNAGFTSQRNSIAKS